ncbi:hypothetical protein ACHAXA_009914 [Cyclostephanos tholiformis]|uniref:Uncharacterized protein n=1 Tax=Cyclostephanos tholiformis TaxID=382380 RepID=A0ABD3RXZ6_9STRA
MEDMMDVGPQTPRGTSGAMSTRRNARDDENVGTVEKNTQTSRRGGMPKSWSGATAATALLIPSLGAGDEWSGVGHREREDVVLMKVGATRKPTYGRRKTTNTTEASPTGIEELQEFEEDRESQDFDNDDDDGGRKGEKLGADDDVVTPSKPAYGWRMTTNVTEASPTGVDELQDFQEDRGSQESDDFFACDDWYSKDNCMPNEDGESTSSQTFGLIKIHESASFRMGVEQSERRSIEFHRDVHDHNTNSLSKLVEPSEIHTCPPTKHLIELRHSVESDCGQSQSSSSFDADLVDDQSLVEREHSTAKDTLTPRFEMAIDESSNKSIESHASLGSFHQVYTTVTDSSAAETTEDSESAERDLPGDYFDSAYEVDTIEPDSKETKGSKNPNSDVVEREHSLVRSSGSKPWAKRDGYFESDSCGSDLETVPSESSMLSLGNVQVDRSVSPTSSVPDVISGNNDKPCPAREDFSNLRNFWLHEWRGMARAEPTPDKVVTNRDSDQPRYLLKEDVGNAMYDDNDGVVDLSTSQTADVAAPDNNIFTDRDGNQYLRIFDLNSGDNIYEVIEQQSYELETVEEGSGEEEDEEETQQEGGNRREEEKVDNGSMSKLLNTLLEKTVESERKKMAGSNQHASLEDLHGLFDKYQGNASLEDLHSLFDRYQGMLKTPPAVFELSLVVKPSKKPCIHTKEKRKIVKAKLAKPKYNLSKSVDRETRPKTKLRKGAPFKKKLEISGADLNVSSESIHASQKSLDNIFSQSLYIISTQESGRPNAEALTNVEDFEDHSSATETPKAFRLVERKFLYASITKNKTNDQLSKPITMIETSDHLLDPVVNEISSVIDDASSSVQSSVPSMSVASAATTHEQLVKYASNGGFLSEFNPSVALSSTSADLSVLDDNTNDEDQPSEINKGTPSMLMKLYEENAQLAETLAATQRELAMTQWKLRMAALEIDEMISTARYEI